MAVSIETEEFFGFTKWEEWLKDNQNIEILGFSQVGFSDVSSLISIIIVVFKRF